MGRHGLSKHTRRAAVLLVLLLGAGAVLYGVLHTAWGRARLAAYVSRTVSERMDGSLRIEGLSGLIPFHMRVERLECSGPEGKVWLSVEGIAATLGPRSLWQRRLLVEQLTAEVIRYRPPPQTRQRDARPPPSMPSLRIAAFQIGELELPPLASGPSLSVRAKGRLDLVDPRGGSRIAIALDHPSFRLEGEADQPDPDTEWRTQVSVRVDADSPLHGPLRLPEGSAWTAQATGEGLHARIEAASPQVGQLTASIQTSRVAEGLRVRCDPAVTVNPELLPGWLRAITGPRFSGTAEIARGATGSWAIADVELRAAGHVARLDVGQSGKEGRWTVAVDADLQEVSYRGIQVAETKLRGRLQWADGIQATLSADPRDIRGIPVDLAAWLGREPRLTADAAYDAGVFSIASGHLTGALGTLKVSGAVSPRDEGVALVWQVTLTEPPALPAMQRLGRLDPVTVTGRVHRARAPGQSLSVSAHIPAGISGSLVQVEPVSATYAEGRGILSPVHIRVGPLGLRVDVTADRDGPRAQVDMEELSLAEVPAWERLSGRVSGRAAVAGTWEQPTVQASASLAELRAYPAETDELPPVSGRFALSAEGGLLHAEAHLATPGADRLDLVTDLPIRFQLTPWDVGFREDVPGALELRGRLDLDTLNALPVMAEQRLSGILDIDIRGTGSPRAPHFSGTGRLERGGYEHVLMGTEIRDLQLEVQARDHALAIRSLTGRDGTGGTLTGDGHVLLRPEESFPFSFRLHLKQTQLLANDLLTAAADGTLTVAGTPARMTTGGALTLSPVRIRIPSYLPAADPGYRVVDPQHPPVPTRTERPQSTVALDTAITAARMTVQGRGLDSEWGGQIHVRGDATRPRMQGTLKAVRGRFNFFGQPFILEEGAVTFTGASPPRPTLDVTFVRSRSDLVARLKIGGNTERPELSLVSDPYLPSDELLPRLLFGRDIREISPLQAVRVAQAARALKGGGSAFDFLGHAQRLLSVDQLAVEQADHPEGVAKVTAGKYLSDRVYIEGQNQAGPDNGRLSLEIELTPRISLETDIQAEMKRGIGLKFKQHF